MDTYILKHWRTMIITSPVSTVDITLLWCSWISTRAVSSAWQVQYRFYLHGEPLHPSRLSNYSIFIFSLVSELEDPPDGFDGEVDIEFWDSLCLETIARGFVPSKWFFKYNVCLSCYPERYNSFVTFLSFSLHFKNYKVNFEPLMQTIFLSGDKQNPFAVKSTYHHWAPWIGPHTRKSNKVHNTEHEKVHTTRHPKEQTEIDVTEARLLDEVSNLKVNRSMCFLGMGTETRY